MPNAVWTANAGAMAIRDGRLFVFRRYDAVLEEYDLKTSALVRTDSIGPIGARAAYDDRGDGMAGSMAALSGGRLALILRHPPSADGEVFPRERLVIVDSLRRMIDAYELTARANRLAFAGGAYLFALGDADSTRTGVGDVVIDLLQLPGLDATDRCGWVPTQ